MSTPPRSAPCGPRPGLSLLERGRLGHPAPNPAPERRPLGPIAGRGGCGAASGRVRATRLAGRRRPRRRGARRGVPCAAAVAAPACARTASRSAREDRAREAAAATVRARHSGVSATDTGAACRVRDQAVPPHIVESWRGSPKKPCIESSATNRTCPPACAGRRLPEDRRGQRRRHRPDDRRSPRKARRHHPQGQAAAGDSLLVIEPQTDPEDETIPGWAYYLSYLEASTRYRPARW